MKIQLIKDKNVWEKSVRNFPDIHFAQSFAWGEVYICEGKEVERLVITEGGNFLAAQIIYQNLPFSWSYGFVPKGPALLDPKFLESFFEYLRKKGCVFVRVEPDKVIDSNKFLIKKSIDINPCATAVLDLTKSEEELLTKMHPKTRYNIRLAEKKGMQIKKEKNLDELLRLMKMTGARDKFRLHKDRHYEEVLNSEIVYQINIENGGDTIAVGVFVGYGSTFTYLYGASDHNFRSLMAPYLVQWEGIKMGKALGFSKYDFFGIAPKIKGDTVEYEYDQKHQYAGVTRFKLGFGGEIKEGPGTYDVLLNKSKYYFYQTLRKLRRLI